jgi:hypothetical protein
LHTGLLWFDNTPNITLNSRLERAADYYRRKYHRDPNLCLVHPSTLGSGQIQLGHLTVREYGAVLPGHFWIGIEDQD